MLLYNTNEQNILTKIFCCIINILKFETMKPTKNRHRVLAISDLGKEAIRITKYVNTELVDEEIWPKAGGNWLHLFEALLCGICFEFFGLKVRNDA